MLLAYKQSQTGTGQISPINIAAKNTGHCVYMNCQDTSAQIKYNDEEFPKAVFVRVHRASMMITTVQRHQRVLNRPYTNTCITNPLCFIYTYGLACSCNGAMILCRLDCASGGISCRAREESALLGRAELDLAFLADTRVTLRSGNL